MPARIERQGPHPVQCRMPAPLSIRNLNAMSVYAKLEQLGIQLPPVAAFRLLMRLATSSSLSVALS